MRMTMEIEIGEIHDRFVGAPGGDFTHPHESSEALNDFHIYQVGRMEFVRVAKDTLFDSDANRGLQEKLQQRRRVVSSRVGRAAIRSSSARR